MTPLESYVNSRMGKAVMRRIMLDRSCSELPSPLAGFIRRKLWRWPYRHMGEISPSVRFMQSSPGAWTITANEKHVTTTRPLTEWIGQINRPVTIVAGGPSARDYPLEKLRNGKRFIIAVNGVPSFLAENGIHPDAWIVSDPRLASQIEANFPHAIGTPLALTATAAASISTRLPNELARRSVSLIERVNQWHGVKSLNEKTLRDLNDQSGVPFLFPVNGMVKSLVGWSHRPELGFFSGCTVAFTALQIIVGLGALDIEIVGMDLSDQGHAYKEGENALANMLTINYKEYILPAFEMMHEALKHTDVKVRNLSPVCPLPQRFFAK